MAESESDADRLLSFARLVRDMRHVQRNYFKYGQREDLRASLDYERRVDEAITLLLDNRQSSRPLQPQPQPLPLPLPQPQSRMLRSLIEADRTQAPSDWGNDKENLT